MFSQRSNIAIIGAGKIAHSLTNSLVQKKYKMNFVVSTNIHSAKKLAKTCSIKKYSDDLKEITSKNKIFILSVPDKQIKPVAVQLAKLKLDFKNSLFIHLSGAENISEIMPLKNKGGITASFHIMQTFPSKKIINIKNCYAAIETNNTAAEKFLFVLSKKLGIKPIKIKPEEKVYYHLAGVFASNFLVGNVFNSEKIFKADKSENVGAFNFLKPIINSTLNNISRLNSAEALSGPVERGDLSTVKKHISSLKKLSKKDNGNSILMNYIVQSLNLLDAAESKNKNLNAGYPEIQKYLEYELKKLFKQINNKRR